MIFFNKKLILSILMFISISNFAMSFEERQQLAFLEDDYIRSYNDFLVFVVEQFTFQGVDHLPYLNQLIQTFRPRERIVSKRLALESINRLILTKQQSDEQLEIAARKSSELPESLGKQPIDLVCFESSVEPYFVSASTVLMLERVATQEGKMLMHPALGCLTKTLSYADSFDYWCKSHGDKEPRLTVDKWHENLRNGDSLTYEEFEIPREVFSQVACSADQLTNPQSLSQMDDDLEFILMFIPDFTQKIKIGNKLP